MEERRILRVPSALPAIESETLKIGFGMAGERPVGALLRTLARSKGKGRFLELGTGTGLSTAWILDGMSPDSTLLTLDNDPLLLEVAKRHLGHDSRLTILCEDGDRFVPDLVSKGAGFDFIFADTWPGKYRHIEETLGLLNRNGLYVIDDMLPQANWPEDHSPKVKALLNFLDGREDLLVTKMRWSTGVVIVLKQ